MSVYEYEDDYDDDDGRPLTRIILSTAAVVVLSALLWFVIRPSLGGGGTTSASTFDPAGTVAAEPELVTTTASASPSTTLPADLATTVPAVATSTAAVVESTTTIPVVTAGSTVAGSSTTDNAFPPDQDASYPTLPDGSPTPVLAIFDRDTITLSGTVPSQAAADRLAQLALANSKTPAALVQFLAIDPDMPANVGVRVLEMTSSRFPAGSSEVLPDHGRELDRIGAVMEALPNTTVLVIGHADQRGSDAANFAVSEDRARAVVSHLVEYGIEGSRLSSRAVGETDLLNLGDDEMALELNRRTEFVIYGALLGA
jgi:outer membrane protein OmpA-like peptidoglycan-associated protein